MGYSLSGGIALALALLNVNIKKVFAVYNKLLCRKRHLIFPEYGYEDMLNSLQDENLRWAMEFLNE
ncbi:acetylxylan esterase [Fusobacterium sp.]|mgnify:CR=1 FL=1|uniref:acetylxylan esterase n=1 Tax=Fusobacterium sp. TaxID=68766 RepID=UPI002904DCA2|nr:acetylxylan esterase [Fusobacterium sp.]MDU1911828.1 acetylxylan esterase [Fusobacterium sp.]